MSVGERTRQLRELFAMSQSHLAQLSGVTQGLISQIEHGRTEPSDETVKALATALGVGTGWLKRGQVVVLPEGTLKFRRRASASERSLLEARRRLEILTEVIRELSVGVRLPRLRLRMYSPPNGFSQIEDMARVTRELLSIPPSGPIHHLTRAAERAGVFVVRIATETDVHDGISVWRSEQEFPLLACRSEIAGDRQRFTIAHELGHLIMHSIDFDLHQAESQANAFAGALLMPREDAIEALSGATLRNLVRLKSFWGISIQALIQRSKALELISSEYAGSLYKQLSARGWRTNEPVNVETENPRLLNDLLENKYGKAYDIVAIARKFEVSPIVMNLILAHGSKPSENFSSLARLGTRSPGIESGSLSPRGGRGIE